MPLIIAPTNVQLLIVKVISDSKTKHFFESLGILPNEKIIVISNTNGNVICLIKDGRIAFDRDIASKIIVA